MCPEIRRNIVTGGAGLPSGLVALWFGVSFQSTGDLLETNEGRG